MTFYFVCLLCGLVHLLKTMGGTLQRTSESHVVALKTASFLFTLLTLLIMVATVLVGDYYTFAVALIISITGILSLSSVLSLILLHCCSLVLLLVYGIVFAFIDGTRRFQYLSPDWKVYYLAQLLSCLTGFMFTVGMLTIYLAYYYRDLKKINTHYNAYV